MNILQYDIGNNLKSIVKVDQNKIETSERILSLSLELDAVRENDLFKTMCLPSKRFHEICLIILAN